MSNVRPVRRPFKARLPSPIKSHGGKHYQAEQVIGLMPPRVKNPNKPADDDPGWGVYAEPFLGSGAVLFALDPEGISEHVNDLDGEITNFFDVVKSPDLFTDYSRLVGLTPVSEVEFDRAIAALGDPDLSPVERAVAFFVRNRQSRAANGKGFCTPVLGRTRRGRNEHCSAWLSAVEGLPAVHERLMRVEVHNRQGIDFIRHVDSLRTFFYLDPPYLRETRVSKSAYKDFEMTRDQHVELLDVLAQIKGRFILSGYSDSLYAQAQARYGWHCTERQIDNKVAGGKVKRVMTERCWMNYQPPEVHRA
jgi:DNA adenine methylase